jgi:hypothetical protein
LDENFYKVVPMESPQKKPGDTYLAILGQGPAKEERRMEP